MQLNDHNFFFINNDIKNDILVCLNRIGGEMVSVLASSAVDRVFNPGRVKKRS